MKPIVHYMPKQWSVANLEFIGHHLPDQYHLVTGQYAKVGTKSTHYRESEPPEVMYLNPVTMKHFNVIKK